MNGEMDLEKRNSKRSFLQLFDWNIKSRKKLFSNKSESSAAEKLNQGNGNLNGSTFSILEQVNRNGHGPGPNMIENYELNCSSYPNGGDMMYGTKAPGVVARLMGLDSLPTLDTVEPSLTPESFRDTHYSRGFPGFQSEHRIMYDGMRNKLDGFSKNPMEVMLHKVQSRPIEKFQTEVLPPKSAKPISITHHRLLSPIKSPGFIRTMDADCLMEAASKIIEQSPMSMMRHKLPSLGSSSVPMRIQDIKEKVEAAEKSRRIFRTSQKGKEQSFTQHERAHGRAEGLDLLRASGKPRAANSEDSRRTKSTSFSFQAKPKIPKRDELGSVDCPVSVNQRQPSEIKRGFIGRNAEKKHKNVEMKSRISKQSDVLRQNNPRQCSEPKEERDTLRRSLPNEKERKPSSSTGFSRPNKTVNRIVVSNYSLSTKTEPLASDSRKEQASSMAKKSARKEVTNVNRVSDEGNVAILSRDEKSINCNYESQKSLWDSAIGKNGMDVVSFTFNSPIKKPSSESTLSGKSPESKRASFVIPDSSNYQSSRELDVASGDTLSILLEQKLKELASRVEASQQDLIYSELLCGSADSSRASVPTVDTGHTTSSKSTNCNSQLDPSGDKAGASFQFDCSSSSSLSESWHNPMPKWQGPNEACNGTLPSYSEGNYKSWDNGRYINKGSKRCLSVEALEISGWSSSRNSQRGVDTELFDSASSTSLGTSTSDITSTFTSSIIKESSNWELDYIRCIITNATSMFEEFALGQAQKLVVPGLFDLMEEYWWNQNLGENLRLSREALFDCVGESLESRCLPLINKGRKHWMKLTMVFGHTDRLSEEMYREISGWTLMEDLMVDELVDKDMSTQLGRWVDFETEEYEEGVQIEEDILTCLFDELISEFFLV